MIDYLQEVKSICEKYLDKGMWGCEGCPFDNADLSLDCDSGCYSKQRWDVAGMKEVINKEIRANKEF